MATDIAVDVTTPDVVGGRYRTTCSCSCGWSLTTSADSPALAAEIAAKARANHREDQHVRRPQARAAVPSPQVERGPHGHTPSVGSAVKEGILWSRGLTCSCGWVAAVSDRTPFTAEKALRAQHRSHVAHETDRAPLRDYVVMLGLLAVVAVLVLVMATTAVDARL